MSVDDLDLVQLTRDTMWPKETIVYRPRSGMPRTITDAVVDRDPPAEITQVPGLVSPTMMVDVPNAYDNGIHSEELDCGGDQVDVAPRIGKTPSARQVLRIITQDAGRLRLGVR